MYRLQPSEGCAAKGAGAKEVQLRGTLQKTAADAPRVYSNNAFEEEFEKLALPTMSVPQMSAMSLA